MAERSLALALVRASAPLQSIERGIPAPAGDEVLLRIQACGV